jgi:hypothetical protein
MALITTVRDLRSLINEVLLTEAAIDANSAKEILKKFPKGMKKVGVDVANVDRLQPLGTGTRGTAFDVGNGKVLKVTNDQQEAAAASALMGKDIKNVVRYFGVWKFGELDAYGILQEKIKSLPANAGEEFNKALVATAVPLWIKRAPGDWDAVKKMTKEYIVSQVKKKFKDNLNSPEAQQFAKGVNEQWNLLITKYGLRDMFQTLAGLGIDFHDYQADNLGMREDGTLVFIDFGNSKIRGGGKIETVTEDRRYKMMGL